MLAGRLVLAALGARRADRACPSRSSDASLAAAPRTPPADVAGAVGVPPDGPPVPPDWAVCDTNPDPAAERHRGDDRPGRGARPVGARRAACCWRRTAGPPSVVLDGVRHRIDPDDVPAMSALGLLGVAPRQVGDGLLSALPEGPPLRTPDVATGADVGELGRTGDIVTSNPLGGGETFFVVLGPSGGRAGGVLPIPATLADAIRTRTGQGTPATMAEGLIAENTVDGGPDRGVDPAGWPAAPVAAHGPRLGTVRVLDVARRPHRPVRGRAPAGRGRRGHRRPGGRGRCRAAHGRRRPARGRDRPCRVARQHRRRDAEPAVVDRRPARTGRRPHAPRRSGSPPPGRAPEEALRLLPRATALDLNTVRDVRDVGRN